jgi:hypothetical protein
LFCGLSVKTEGVGDEPEAALGGSAASGRAQNEPRLKTSKKTVPEE